MEIKKRAKKYKTRCIHYFENALKSIDAGDKEKASEFLWGSMAQALKALAASKGIWLGRHDDIRKYAMESAKALKDETIWHAFEHAQSLHSNFYESGLTLEDVLMGAEEVKTALAKLLTLIPNEKQV